MERVQELEREKAAGLTQYLTFYAGKELYGFEVSQVREVIEYHRVYAIPRTPEYIRGVINLRGEVLPVIDLSSLFYGRKSEIGVTTSIVFIERRQGSETVVVGVMIDAVEAVTDIVRENIEATPAFGEKIRPEYIGGVGKVGERFVILLDVPAVLNIESLSRFGAEAKAKGA